MKKEHWLYIVIAILAIWIIASYATAPKTEAPAGENENDSESSQLELNNDENATTSPVSVLGVVGVEAGPNKGILTSNTVSSNNITVSDQLTGGMVKIDSVSLTFDGWVVVHEDASGEPGWILGAQRFDSGAYSGGQVELLRNTVAGSKYHVMLHEDDGDKMFNHKLDIPYMNGTTMITATFVAQ